MIPQNSSLIKACLFLQIQLFPQMDTFCFIVSSSLLNNRALSQLLQNHLSQLSLLWLIRSPVLLKLKCIYCLFQLVDYLEASAERWLHILIKVIWRVFWFVRAQGFFMVRSQGSVKDHFFRPFWVRAMGFGTSWSVSLVAIDLVKVDVFLVWPWRRSKPVKLWGFDDLLFLAPMIWMVLLLGECDGFGLVGSVEGWDFWGVDLMVVVCMGKVTQGDFL